MKKINKLFPILFLISIITFVAGSFVYDKMSQFNALDGHVNPVTSGDPKITVINEKETFSIQPSNNDWMINEFVANSDTVKTALTAFDTLTKATIISRKKAKHPTFDITPTSSRVILQDPSSGTLSLTLGKLGPSSNSTYFALEGSDNVLLANTNLYQQIPIKMSQWKDKTLLSFELEKLTTFIFKDGDYSLRITPTQDPKVWHLQGDEQQVTANIQAFGGAFKTLQSTTPTDRFKRQDIDKKSIQTHSQMLSYSVEKQPTVNIHFFNQPDQSIYATSSLTEDVFFIDSQQAAFFQQLISFFSKNYSTKK